MRWPSSPSPNWHKSQSEPSDCVVPPTIQQAVCAQQEETSAAFHRHKMFFLCSQRLPVPENSILPSDLLQWGDVSWKGVILKCNNVQPEVHWGLGEKKRESLLKVWLKLGLFACKPLNTTPWLTSGGRWRGQWVHTVMQISIQLDICNIKLLTFNPPYYTFRDRLMQRCSTRQGKGNRKRMKTRKRKGKKEKLQEEEEMGARYRVWRSEVVKWSRKGRNLRWKWRCILHLFHTHIHT